MVIFKHLKMIKQHNESTYILKSISHMHCTQILQNINVYYG